MLDQHYNQSLTEEDFLADICIMCAPKIDRYFIWWIIWPDIVSALTTGITSLVLLTQLIRIAARVSTLLTIGDGSCYERHSGCGGLVTV